jgi:uncharacterized protein (DUF362 family)/Pyruvate/2-oxoacid:ferredoxin oxidoreductase delta subunit
MMTKVSLLSCPDYDTKQLTGWIESGLRNIDFDLEQFEGKRVALKPNILIPAAPETGITTHPEVLRAAARVVRKYGGKPSVIECPATRSLKRAIRETAFEQVAQDEGIEVANQDETRVLRGRNGRRFNRFEILQAFLNVDIILNLSKLKTHDFTYMSGCVKNLFGVIPGLNKTKWHAKAPNRQAFSEFLLDLYGALLTGFEPQKPIVHIMDAILAVEGDGPGKKGTPRHVGALLTGRDGIAVDYVAAKLVSLDVNSILTIQEGIRRGCGITSFDEVEIVGDRLDELRVCDFRPPGPKPALQLQIEQRFVFSTFFKNMFTEKPVPRRDRCRLCYECRTVCPVGAIDLSCAKRGVPRYDYNKCIRCYCCMEICPEAAIDLKRGPLQWTIG